jgi:ElaB/YqjD/DUF883 family membrane-anchored ribosome-binding protein
VNQSSNQSTRELKTQIEHQRAALGQDLDALADRVSPRRIAQRRKAAMSDSISSVRDRIMGTAGGARDATTHAASEVADRASEVPAMARQQVEGNPIAAGVLAFAAGLVVAAVLPETERERAVAERLQPHVEQVAGEVGRAAQESAQHLRPAAEEAAGHLKEQAQGAAQHVRDQAKESAQATADATRSG